MNRKRGLKRLAIALLVPWFTWWWGLGLLAYNTAQSSSKDWLAASQKNDEFMMGVYNRMQVDAYRQIDGSLTWGVAVPIVVLIVAAIGYWVYRGFKPKTSS